jgi:hypothetical protein
VNRTAGLEAFRLTAAAKRLQTRGTYDDRLDLRANAQVGTVFSKRSGLSRSGLPDFKRLQAWRSPARIWHVDCFYVGHHQSNGGRSNRFIDVTADSSYRILLAIPLMGARLA